MERKWKSLGEILFPYLMLALVGNGVIRQNELSILVAIALTVIEIFRKLDKEDSQ